MLHWVAARWFIRTGSVNGWRRARHNVKLTAMSEWSALDAGIGGFYASKTLSKGQRTRAQTRPPQGMGGAMVGARRTAFEGPRTLLGNYKKPGRCAHGFYSSAIERRRRTAAGSSLYVRRLSGQSLPPVVSAEVEGVDPHDHGSDN